MKLILSVIIGLLFFSPLVYANNTSRVSGTSVFQNRMIEGVVVDEEGVPIEGVNVLVKGASQGTATDAAGKFSMSSVSSQTVLVFSFMGFKTQEVVVGDQATITVVLELESELLGEVVIDALGFERKTDKLGSAVASVKSKDLVNSGEVSLVNSMQGKMSGVNITRSNGDPGAGSNIRIRGANTILGSTQPLIIVDGIPISNSSRTTASSSAASNGVAQQSRLNDINPNDIATLQVLKGASAAALWGSRASNGVVIITTKSGKKGFKVSYRGAFGLDQITAINPIQRNFGQGNNGVFSEKKLHSWGDEISKRKGGTDTYYTDKGHFLSDNGKEYYPIKEKNSKEDFYQRNLDQVFGLGVSAEHGVSVSGGDSDGNKFFFSLGALNHDGIIKNNSYERYTLNLNATRRFNKYFKLSAKAKYSRVQANRIQQNSNTAGLMLSFYRNPVGFDITDYRGTYVDKDGLQFLKRQRSYRNPIGANLNSGYNNPLFVINDQKAPSVVNRYIYSSELDIYPITGMNIKIRGGVDTYGDKRIYYFPPTTARASSHVPRLVGAFVQEHLSETELNLDLIARYEYYITPEISSSAVLGWNINDRNFERSEAISSRFLENQEIYNFSNSQDYILRNYEEHIRSNRAYGTMNFSMYDQVYIDLSGAFEAASTIQDVFFYPSASVAWQVSNASFFPKDNGVLNFAKARFSIGKVGTQPQPYKTATFYEGGFQYSTYYGSLGILSNGGGYRLDNDQGASGLKPEIKTEMELGTELRFLDNLISFGVTYYRGDVEDVLLNIGTAPSTGFATKYINGAAITNQGLEMDFSVDVLKQQQEWKGEVYSNFTLNRNKVTRLEGAEFISLGGLSTGRSVAVEGQPLGVIWGGRLLRDDAGEVVLDGNGFPKQDPQQGIIGDPNPDWRGGLGFRVGYKGVLLNVFFEHSQGGDFYGMTRQINSQRGHHEDVGNTVTIPEGGALDFKGNSYGEGQVVRGNLKDFGAGTVLLNEYWYRGRGATNSGISELWIQDATWTRLREVSLTYAVDSEWLKDLWVTSASIGITGRNLFLWTSVAGVDPDINLAGVGNSRGLEYYTNPATRSYLLDINLTF